MRIKTRRLHLTVCMAIVWFTGLGSAFVAASPPPAGKKHHCGYAGHRHDTGRSARTLEHLNVGEPRTVRMKYFLPTEREFDAEVVVNMKREIRTVQKFLADEMESHGYGRLTSVFETDDRGEPVVHRVDARHPLSHYDMGVGEEELYIELERNYDFNANVYFIVLGADTLGGGNGSRSPGLACETANRAVRRWRYAVLTGCWQWWRLD